jgi:hypothetical protein
MKKLLYLFVLLAVTLTACGPTAPAATPTATETVTPAATSTPLPTPTETAIPTPAYPAEGYGPANFPAGVNPLTGLTVADPALLDRRPMVIKVSNLPRNVRPQWGLSLADIVFEYYTEEGSTRFAAVFYGKDASMVGPIRSGRFIDGDIVRGYKAVFAFGSAYIAEMTRFLNSDFASRLVVEGPNTPLFRYEPNGADYLVVNTADLSAYATQRNLQNTRQALDGMFFKLQAPEGGQAVTQVKIHYSLSIYSRWDYDATQGKYLRFSDAADIFNGQTEQYEQLTDRLTNQPLAFDNVVVLFVDHELYSPGIYDIQLSGSGDAYVFRDEHMYTVKWQRNATDVVTLLNADGTPFPFKPGNTWYEVVGLNTSVSATDQGISFKHLMP